MNKKTTEPTSEKKYFVFFETDEEGIRQYQSCSDQDKSGSVLSKMCIEGKTVPALKLEVTKSSYDIFKREQWIQEHRYRIENRCIISGKNGKSKFCPCRLPNPAYTLHSTEPKTVTNTCISCPYNHMFRVFKGKLFFSSLSVTDEDGNEDLFEPESQNNIVFTDSYNSLLQGWIRYIENNYPKYSKYVPLIKLLGQEYTLKEAAAILNKPQRTLYGWIKTLKPIFKEYMQTVDYI